MPETECRGLLIILDFPVDFQTTENGIQMAYLQVGLHTDGGDDRA